MSMLHLLVVGDDIDKHKLDLLDPKQRDNKVSNTNFPPDHYISVADEDRATRLGVHWYEGQPNAVKETKKLLLKPEILNTDLIAEIEHFFSKLDPAINISSERLHDFLRQHSLPYTFSLSHLTSRILNGTGIRQPSLRQCSSQTRPS